MLCIDIEVVKNIGICDSSSTVRTLQNENGTFNSIHTLRGKKKKVEENILKDTG